MLALARAPRERARIGYANGGYRASAKPGSRQRIQRPRRRGASWKPIVHMRSFASILAHPGHVCFSPESDQKSGRAGLVAKCQVRTHASRLYEQERRAATAAASPFEMYVRRWVQWANGGMIAGAVLATRERARCTFHDATGAQRRRASNYSS
jgi:hypothetical protein